MTENLPANLAALEDALRTGLYHEGRPRRLGLRARAAVLPTVVSDAGSTPGDVPDQRGARWLGWAAVVVSVVVVVVVAVAALSLVRRGHAPRRPAAAPGTVASIVGRMAVLRRPQTAADRDFPVATDRFVDRSLLRLATTVTVAHARVRVFVQVRDPQRSATTQRPASVLAVATGPGDRTVAADSSDGLGARFDPASVTSGWQVPAEGLDPTVGVSVGIVPDGVVRVRWVFSGLGVGVSHPRPVIVTPRVTNNIAIAPVVAGQGPLTRATWYGALGQIIATSADGARAAIQRQGIQNVDASRSRPIDSFLLAHFRLFRSVPADDPARDWRLAQAAAGGDDGIALNYWRARYLEHLSGLDGQGVWIIPGTRGVCILDPRAGTCGPITLRQQRSVLPPMTTSNGRKTTITGLVPDGNPTVTIILASSSRRRIAVLDNVFEATVTSRPLAILAYNAAGHLTRLRIG